MAEEEPRTIGDDSSEKKSKKLMASVLTSGLIIGFLIVLFAVVIIVINLFPYPDKWEWFLTLAPLGNKILLIGTGLLIFFLSLTVCIYIWNKGRPYFQKRL
ncbi:MAG TPA: hypothetical protein VMV49_13165 [Candidatus Deferrimicrobium sp.]|nr:hypothetical protein [Candidatus Deferrimicrobium sp.]